jgi:hypothetical protein
MPSRQVYISKADEPVYVEAERLAKARGLSLSTVITQQLKEWITRMTSTAVQLYWTNALPNHYVAIKPDGTRWLISCSPISPDVWISAKPYKGDYILDRVCPTAIERYYQPAD